MMKNITFLSMILVLSGIFLTIHGQYTGTNLNVAISKLVVASDSIAGLEPGKAVDDEPTTYASIPGTAPAWIQVNLGTYHYIDGYGLILPDAMELPKEYTIQVSADESAWTDLGTETITVDGAYSYDVTSPDPVRFVRINMTDKDNPASFSEIQVFGIEMEPPVPPTSYPATNVSATGFTAHWSELSDADGYVISVATDPGFTSYVTDYNNKWVGLSISWDITGLDPATTYYYKVRAYNLAGTSFFGNVISVTTDKAEQTITFNPLADVTYGDADFELMASASSGLTVSYTSSDENVATVSGTTVTLTGTGTASITALQEGNDQYFAATPVAQDLTVTRKELTVEGATAENKVYDGTDDAVVSGATLTGVIGTDDIVLVNAEAGIFAQADADTGIAVTTSMEIAGADTVHYFLAGQPALKADITPKELVVMAEDKSREECSPNPEFTIGYSGFVGTEGAEVLTTEPVASCTADDNSPDGTYDIVVSGGSADNYIFVYVSGLLTVTPDATPPELEIRNITVQLDASRNAVISPADVVVSASDNCTLADTILSQFIFTDSDIGDVNVDVTVSDETGNQTAKTAVVTVEDLVGLETLSGMKINIYPNPTYGMVHLEMSTRVDELKVMDITGKVLERRSSTATKETFDLSGHHSGIYVIQISGGGEVMYYKIVKR